MSSIPPLEAPLRVSSLIRVGRWSLLGLGILYGMSRHSTLHAREQKKRDKNEQEKPAREAREAAEKTRIYREEMIKLAKDTNTPVPPNF